MFRRGEMTLALALVVGGWGCDDGEATPGGPAPDSGVDAAIDGAVGSDALPDRDAAPDAAPDAAHPDALPADRGPPDAIPADRGAPDMAPADLGEPDAIPPDLGPLPDAAPPPEPLALEFAEPPFAAPEGSRFAEAVAYGPDPQQIFDVALPPPGEAASAAVIFIHGGGFTGGTRTQAWQNGAGNARTTLERGMAYFSLDYRLLRRAGDEDEGVIKSMRDSRRALQFIRRHAADFGIDPARIGLMGSSAGAGTSMWIAFNDDMADPRSPDVVERESTRVTAIAVSSPQATYDLVRWGPDVFSPTYPLDLELLVAVSPALVQRLVQFYGLPGALADDRDALLDAMETPEMVAYRAEVDMLALYTADDPPTLINSNRPDAAPGAPDFDLLHHPLHGLAIEDRGVEVGAMDHVLIAPALDYPANGENPLRFVLDRLE